MNCVIHRGHARICVLRFAIGVMLLAFVLFASVTSWAAAPGYRCSVLDITDNFGGWTGVFVDNNSMTFGQTDDDSLVFRIQCQAGLGAGHVVRVYRDGVYVPPQITALDGSRIASWTDPGPLTPGVHVYRAIALNTSDGLYGFFSTSAGFIFSTCAGGPVVCAGDTSWNTGGGTVAPEGFVLAWMGLAVAVFGVGFLGGVKA